MKRSALILGLMILIISSCGKKEKSSESTVMSASGKLVELAETYKSGTKDITDARLFLSEATKLIEGLNRNAETSDSMRAIPVTVTSLVHEPISSEVAYLGDVQSSHSVRVYTKVPDKIRKFYVEVGDYVTPGTPMVQIADDLLAEGVKQAEAALNSARSSYENIQKEYQRIEKLYSENAVSQSAYDQMKTQKLIAANTLEQAKAGYNSANKQFSDALVKAPITGFVTERNFEVGDMAAMQMPLVTISKIGTMKTVLNVIEKDVAALKVGDDAVIDVQALPDKRFFGKVTKISPVIDPQTRTSTVEVEIDNSENLLKPGMFARVRIIIGRVDDAWVIDKDIVNVQTYQEKDDLNMRNSEILKQYSVYVVENNLSFRRFITPGIITRDRIQVLDGIDRDAVVINIGRNLVRDSSLVSIVE